MQLLEGSRGDQVRALQRVLTYTGHYDGRDDGWWGPKTEVAVRNTQRQLGTTVDGWWGPESQTRLANIFYGVTGVFF